MCPGISFALRVVRLTLGALLHGFEITTTLDEPIDMRETGGLSSLAPPLDLMLLLPHVFLQQRINW